MSEFLDAAMERMKAKAKTLGLLGDDWPELVRASPEAMEEFNRRFFHIRNFGNRSRIGEMKVRYYGKDNERKDHYLSTRSLPEFLNAYRGDKVIVSVNEKGLPIKKTKAEVWLEYSHPTVEEVVFRPNEETPAELFNLWQGFAFTPKKGNGATAAEGCQLYLNHIRDNICRGNGSHYKVVKSWMAWAVKHPEKRANWAIAVNGKKGVGKNVAFEPFINLFGEHGIVIAGEHAITSHFNTHLMNKVVVLADEALFAKDPKQDRLIKGLITHEQLRIEPKGIDSFQVPSFLHTVIIGNDEQLVFATLDERRYFMLECGEERRGQQEYFRAIMDELKHGGYEALLYHLLNEVTLFEMQDAPQTDALKKRMSKPPVEELWLECLTAGTLPGRVNDNKTVDLRLSNFIEWAHKSRKRGFDSITTQDVINLLHKGGLNLTTSHVLRLGKETTRTWLIPSLAEARANYDEHRPPKRDWPKAEDKEDEWECVIGSSF